jgi:type I restriction enzyme S subunit
MGELAALEVPLPDFLEQRRIADWLDLQTTRIDKRRALLAKKRELLRDLRSNLIAETLARGLRGQETTPTGLADLPALPVGWQASHTKRLLRFITSGSRGWAEYYAEAGDIFLRIGNLTRETIDLDLSDMKYVALPAKAAEGKRTRLRQGDLLVSITADLGSIAVVPELEKPAYVSQHIALCRPKAGVHPRWLGYAMVSRQAKRQLLNSGYGGTKIQLSLDDVRNVWLAVPPLDEQIVISDFLDQRLRKIARQITLIDQLDDLLQQQRKALIDEAVTGKIDLSAAPLDAANAS